MEYTFVDCLMIHERVVNYPINSIFNMKNYKLFYTRNHVMICSLFVSELSLFTGFVILRESLPV